MKNKKQRKGQRWATGLHATVWLLALGSMSAWVWQGSQTSRSLYQQAVHEEEAVGNAAAAIELYRRVVAAPEGDRVVAAKAELRLAALLAKVGRMEEAETHYENIVSSYGGDPALAEIVKAAREKLAQPRASANKSQMVVRRIWTGFRYLGRVSPDGRYIGFRDRESGDLALRDLTTGENRRLKKGGGRNGFERLPRSRAKYSTFSPDGKQIAYGWRNKEGFDELRIMGIDGSGERLLYRNSEILLISPWGWSPDGKDILVGISLRDNSWRIGWVSVEDGSLRVLKSLGWSQPQVRLSPDGQYIAYNFQASKNHDVFLLATDGSRETPLIEHPGDDKVLEWTSDGKSLLFWSDRTGSDAGDLWAIRVAGGKPQGSPQLVKNNIGDIRGRGLTLKGSFYYRFRAFRGDVYVATLDPTTGEVLVPPRRISQRFVGRSALPDWSPDGRYLAYVIRSDRLSPKRGSHFIAICDVETREERYIRQLLGFPRWSPDGRSLLVGTRGEDRRFRLGQMDAQTGNLIPIVRMPRPGLYPFPAAWFPDGKEILYAISDGAARSTKIMRRNLETGQETALSSVDQASYPFGLAISPDGRRLALLSPQNRPTTLKVMPATGGEPQELFSVQEPDYLDRGVLAWTPDGEHLLFGRFAQRQGEHGQRTTALWRISARGGKPQRLELEIEGPSMVRVHPDGRQIAFRGSKTVDELWVMENFLPQLSSNE
ncbi:hypothetical protein MYX65_10785 [Acidobacteria bacterium AH-259-L09]|nr:hypothetical protein [Acidobacteria bacterium AH-259-L09]